MTPMVQQFLTLPYSQIHPLELIQIECDNNLSYYNDDRSDIFIGTDMAGYCEDHDLFCLASLLKKAKELYSVEFIRFVNEATTSSNFPIYKKKNEN
jgi:hypothetical protein